MAKTNQERINDSLTYIRNHFGASFANDIRGLVTGREAIIGPELSLGTRWDGLSSQGNKDGNTQKRHALRALLLCQRVYYSDLWPCLMGVVSARAAVNWLPNNWNQQSIQFWGNRSELQIREGIRMYVATSDNATLVANAAVAGQPSAPNGPALTHTRNTFTGTSPTATCYDAVMLWLFKSGLVSLRWLLKYRNANTQADLTEAFGEGQVIWNGAFGNNDHLPAVPRGHIVHIYEDPQSWRGHWMVSTGNGKSAGCNNNDEDPPVPRDYCAALTLDKQFRDYGRGTAVVINPALIPNRL